MFGIKNERIPKCDSESIDSYEFIVQQKLKLNPKNVGLWYLMGRYLKTKGDFLGAEQALKKALELSGKGNLRVVIEILLLQKQLGKDVERILRYFKEIRI